MAYTPQKTILEYITSIFEAVQHTRTLSAVRGVLNDLRVSVINTVGVTGSLTSVTTVSTVTNQSQIGGLTANQVVPANQNTVAVLSNINNIIIS